MKISTIISILIILLLQSFVSCAQNQQHIFDFYTAEDVCGAKAIDVEPVQFDELHNSALLSGFNARENILYKKLAIAQPG